jgi:hypothetical protein
MVIDRVLRRAQLDESWGYRVQTRRRSLGDIYVTDLAFADDITLISSEFSYADLMLQAVAASGHEAGLEINVEKTEVLVVGDLAAASPDWTLSLDGVPLRRVQNFKYLGSLILNTREELARCIHRAAYQTGVLQNVWAAPICRKVKVRLFRVLIDPILFYACETWTTTEADLALARRARNRLLRRALRIRWFHYVSNSTLSHHPSTDQPLLKLLWFVPNGATKRRGQGNRTTFHSQLVSLLQLTSIHELRSFAEHHDAADFRRWYTSQCRQRWDTPPEDRRAPRSHGLTGVAMLSSPTSADGISLAALVNLSL